MEIIQSNTLSSAKNVPGPRGVDALKTIMDLKKDSCHAYISLRERYGDLVYVPFIDCFFIFHPIDVERVLKDNAKNYLKSKLYKQTKYILGKGLVTSEGELWKRQRRSVGRAFHQKSIQQYAVDMNSIAKNHFDILENRLSKQQCVNIFDIMTNLTFSIACKTIFDVEFSEREQGVKNAFETASEIVIKRAFSPINIPRLIPTPQNIREKNAAKVLDLFLYRIIEKHRKSKSNNFSVLSKLMELAEDSQQMSPEQLRDEAMTLLFAGHDTTSNGITWTLYLLSQNPKAYQKLQKEIDETIFSNQAEMEDLNKLTYLKCVWKESLRLLPPVPHVSRQTIREDLLGGRVIPKSKNVLMSMYAVQRDSRFFEKPEQFIPERFENDHNFNTNGICYFPFVEGPRKCIGYDFANVEAALILVQFLKRFKFELKPGFFPTPKASVTLYPKNGMMMNLQKHIQ